MLYQSMREQLVLRIHSNRPGILSVVQKRLRRHAYISRVDFNSSNQVSTFPIKHSDASLSFYAEKNTATEALSLEAYVKAAALLQLLEEFDAGARFADCVVRWILM